MEKELQEIIERENRLEEEDMDDGFGEEFNVDMFETKIKFSRPQSRMGQQQVYDSDSSQEKEKRHNQSQQQIKKKQSVEKQKPQQDTLITLKMKKEMQKQLLIGNNRQNSQQFYDNNNNNIINNNSTNNNSNISQIQQQITTSKQINKLKPLEETGDQFSIQKMKLLVKNNKNLQVQYEKEKVLREKLEKQIKELELQTQKDLEINKDKQQQIKDYQSQNSYKMNETQLSEMSGFSNNLQQKQLEKKQQEMRYKIEQLKSDLNKCLRIIKSEIGEQYCDMNAINSLILEENQWKGRAQQIEILKAKLSQQNSTTNNQSLNSYHRDQNKQQNQYKQENMKLNAEVQQLQENVQTLTKNNQALKSRLQILENNLKDKQSNFDNDRLLLIEKSNNDDKYIELLKKELDKLQKQFNNNNVQTKIIYKNIENQNINNNNNEDQIQELNSQIKQMQKKIKQKDQQIKELELNKQGEEKTSQELKKIQLLENKIKALEKENEDQAIQIHGKQDKETLMTVRELSQMNAKLRMKVDQLQSALENVCKQKQ